MSWTRQQAKGLTDQILSYSRAKECEVSLEHTQLGHTRFAANDITTSGSSRTIEISITSRDGKRSGTTHANDLDAAVLQEVVARSEELMEAASPDPEYVEGLGQQKYPEIHAFHEETAKARAVERAVGVKTALDLSQASGLFASGFSENVAHWSAIANKKRNFGFASGTTAVFSTTMRTEDGTGSGWAGMNSPRFTQIPAQALATRAAKKAEMSANPKTLEPGRYTVILEPQAVADLMGIMVGSLSRRLADEGRSFLSKQGGGNRLGEKIFPDLVTLRSDPFDPRIAGRPWAGGGGGRGGGLGFGGFGGGGAGFHGLPSHKTTWIEKGVVKSMTCDRYWAAQTKTMPVAFSGGLMMNGGSGTIDSLVAGTDRGLLITHFFYIRVVNPQNVELTGLTRDGVWLVEKGKIVQPVNNFRFNQSPVNLLKNIEALSAAVPTAGGGMGGSMIMPAIRARDFSFTSQSDAV